MFHWLRNLSLTLILCTFFSAGTCADTSKLTPTEARQLAEEAYIYGFGIVENYKALFGMSIAKQSPAYSGFNNYLHGRKLYDPDYTTVVSPNNDTFYSTTWADLSREPLVIEVPPTGDTYFVVQLVDMVTDNFAYIGTRTTGTEGGTFLLTGPDNKGAFSSDKFDQVITSQSRYVALATRTATDGTPEGNEKAFAIQDGLKLAPLSQYLGEGEPKPVVDPEFSIYNADKLYGKPALFTYLNQFLTWQTPSIYETELMKRLSQIHIGPYQEFSLDSFSPVVQSAIKEGIRAGHEQIVAKANSLGQRIDGWEYIPPMGDYGQNYLFRSAVAYKFIYTNSPEEAIYPIAEADGNNRPLDGSQHNYVLRFAADELPPVKAFWSMTMYHSDTRLMVKNPIQRYSIGDRTPGLQYDEDGSLTLYLQKDSPGEDLQSNWLPAPDGPFYIIARMYIPKAEALNGDYRLPAISRQ
ncbi:DUF1254 domain-containing protein [Gilvimarinus xylanilyticus]|uniref:DUF1214 domain-containing protein n=1 Tax=Gilvimarinus xylanilyticus TaxID=2944139 RepID=A0A9X2KU62_9GAMM|nr:DUF1254 domain-containing protein [Gilvimarinus xylanilyticus]MCP8899503.1 DUF1214 domain-containing protein [Gilvimarinus xylanilyticus]